MAGVRSDVGTGVNSEQAAEECLTLREYSSIPLRTALEGLPAPRPAKGMRASEGEGAVSVRVTMPADASCPIGLYLHWVTRPRRWGLTEHLTSQVDAHFNRKPRSDDKALFELIGPGRRWMDYRCDDSATLRQLRDLFDRLQQLVSQAQSSLDRASPLAEAIAALGREVGGATSKLDGSMSLRLLLECIEPREGELHPHLLTDSYLGKKEGTTATGSPGCTPTGRPRPSSATWRKTPTPTSTHRSRGRSPCAKRRASRPSPTGSDSARWDWSMPSGRSATRFRLCSAISSPRRSHDCSKPMTRHEHIDSMATEPRQAQGPTMAGGGCQATRVCPDKLPLT
jgi:hypothetical protein